VSFLQNKKKLGFSYSEKTVASFFLRGVLSRRHAAVKERIKSLLHIFLGFRAYSF